MSCEIICDNCGREIPEGARFVERADGKCFCNDECDEASNDARYVDYDEWLNDLNVGNEVIVEQPAYRFRYYCTTVSEVTPDGIRAKGFSSALFNDGLCMVGGFKYLLLKPTDKLLDKINIATSRRRLNATDWYKVDDVTVRNVFDLVYGD